MGGSHAGAESDIVHEFVFADSYDLNELNQIALGYKSLAEYLSEAVQVRVSGMGLAGNVLCRNICVRRNVVGSGECVKCRRHTFRQV